MTSMEHLPGLILGFTALAIFIAVALYVIGKIRRSTVETKTPSAEDLLVRFGKMRDDGDLSQEEFRAIRSIFASSLRATRAEANKSRHDSDDSADSDRDAQLEALLRSGKR